MTLVPTITDFRVSLKGADPIVGQQLVSSGWYVDQLTGQYYYYDASKNQWYVYAAGILTPLEVPKLPAPKVVDIAGGDTLRVKEALQRRAQARAAQAESQPSEGTAEETKPEEGQAGG